MCATRALTVNVIPGPGMINHYLSSMLMNNIFRSNATSTGNVLTIDLGCCNNGNEACEHMTDITLCSWMNNIIPRY
jgi:hypothetical protein